MRDFHQAEQFFVDFKIFFLDGGFYFPQFILTSLFLSPLDNEHANQITQTDYNNFQPQGQVANCIDQNHRIKTIGYRIYKCRNALSALDSGKAFEKFKEWISAQGGDANFADDTSLFQKALYEKVITSSRDGYISAMDAEKTGYACCLLGAGRKTKTDIIDMSAGIILEKKTGDSVKCGDVVARLYSNDDKKLEAGEKAFVEALSFSDKKPDILPLILAQFD